VFVFSEENGFISLFGGMFCLRCW